MKRFPCGVLAALCATPVWADVSISASPTDPVPKEGAGPPVMVRHSGANTGGTTSFRLQTDEVLDDNKFYGVANAPNNNRVVPPTEPRLQQRDRDLGQTFLTGEKGFVVDSLYLRVGFSDKAVLTGAPGAKIAVQWFEVSGTPRLNDSGTPGFLGTFDRARAPELDDYLDGETYRSVHLSRPGVLPKGIGKGDYLRFQFSGKDAVKLKPNTHYAFLILFTERGADRQLALANAYYGTYTPDPKNPLVGHGIRREGGAGKAEAPFFKPNLPDDLKQRSRMTPGTLGFPDVCTWRDLYFAITARR